MYESFDIEKSLNDIDFSAGHKKRVWDKVLLRLKENSDQISIEDLDNVAGGLSKINEKKFTDF